MKTKPDTETSSPPDPRRYGGVIFSEISNSLALAVKDFQSASPSLAEAANSVIRSMQLSNNKPTEVTAKPQTTFLEELLCFL